MLGDTTQGSYYPVYNNAKHASSLSSKGEGEPLFLASDVTVYDITKKFCRFFGHQFAVFQRGTRRESPKRVVHYIPESKSEDTNEDNDANGGA